METNIVEIAVAYMLYRDRLSRDVEDSFGDNSESILLSLDEWEYIFVNKQYLETNTYNRCCGGKGWTELSSKAIEEHKQKLREIRKLDTDKQKRLNGIKNNKDKTLYNFHTSPIVIARIFVGCIKKCIRQIQLEHNKQIRKTRKDKRLYEKHIKQQRITIAKEEELALRVREIYKRPLFGISRKEYWNKPDVKESMRVIQQKRYEDKELRNRIGIAVKQAKSNSST